MSSAGGPNPRLSRRRGRGRKARVNRSSDPNPRLSRSSRPTPEVSRLSKTLERIAIVIVSFAIAIFAIALLSGYFTAHDPGGVTGVLSGPGLVYKDLGNAELGPGQARPVYDSNPPTSGPHVPTPVRTDRAVLTDNEILTALSAGDVVLLYGGGTPPPGLAQLAQSTGGPFSPALAAAGAAVILGRLPAVNGIIALAWTRMLTITGIQRVTARNDGVLRQFIESWLGKGAGGTGNN